VFRGGYIEWIYRAFRGSYRVFRGGYRARLE